MMSDVSRRSFRSALADALDAPAAVNEPSSPIPSESEEPPKKKKRVAPTVVTDSLVNVSGPRPIPTEADIFTTSRVPSYSDLSGDGSPDQSIYLSSHRLTLHEIVGPDPNVDPNIQQPISWYKKHNYPPGRRLQVNRAFKRYLGPARLNKREDSSSSPKDNILPLFGESDEEYDSDTLREIEDEEKERAAAEKKLLTKAEVDDAIQRGIQGLADYWAEKKKPVLDRKAFRLWNRHRRFNTRKAAVAKAVHRLRELDPRVVNICNEIRGNQWRNQAELQRQMESLRGTVFAIEHERWLVAMLNSPTKPAKPQILRKSDLPRKVPETTTASDEDICTSSDDSDDGMDDFVVPDSADHDLPAGHDLMETDSLPGSPRNSRSAADLRPTQQPALPAPADPAGEGADCDSTQIRTTSALDAEQADPSGTRVSPADLPASSVEQFHDLASIADVDLAYWENAKDPKRLVVAVLCRWDPTLRTSMLNYVKEHEPDGLWDLLVVRAIERKKIEPDQTEVEGARGKTSALPQTDASDKIAFMLARLFEIYVSCSSSRVWVITQLKGPSIARINSGRSSFSEFCQLLREVEPKLGASSAQSTSSDFRLMESSTSGEEQPEGEAGGKAEDRKQDEEQDEVDEQADNIEDDIGTGLSDEDDGLPLSPANKRRRRRIVRDKAAEDMRETTKRRAEEYAERRQVVLESAATTGAVPENKTRLIINAAKADDQSFIYVHDRIAAKIKPHQIEGVRFMWSQIISQSNPRQGCLLAHTMGLGKTMQVITLLVAIAEAAQSSDPTVSSQIPNGLREPKTLVLCPTGLADNWIDELFIWTPFVAPDRPLLGQFFKVSSLLPERTRHAKVREWAEEGGVLVIGYTLYARLYKVEETAKRLREAPNIVVADEAHILKNPKSEIHLATADFRTKSRIAMTGSPLTNHVLDYFAMIDWVAPNYLSSESEFKAVYANPINQGLYADSTASDKRRAIKMLNILKELVAPKVHRIAINAVKSDLPQKKEFVIYLRLTQVQMDAYRAYVDHVTNNEKIAGQMTSMSRVWSFVSVLSSLLAHPNVFRETLQKRKNAREAAEREESGSTPSTPSVGDEDEVDFPQMVLSDVLSTVASRGITDPLLSWKIVLLMRIVEESKRMGDKVLVFSQQIPTLDFLQEILRRQRFKVARLDGKTPVSDRQAAIKEFNTDAGAEVYLISTKAGGVGLNIHGANRVVIFDFKYVPADEQQAVGRAYRMTQTKPVFVYWLLMGGTFEETIQNRSVFKSQLAWRLVDKKQPIAWSKRNGDYFARPKIRNKAKNLSDFLGEDRVLDSLLNSKDLEDGIRSIIMTETFEEEEPDDNILTNEDRQEMSDMVAKNKSRVHVPRLVGSPSIAPTPVSHSPIPLPTSNGAVSLRAPTNYHHHQHQSQNGPLARESFQLSPLNPSGNERTGLMLKIKVPDHLRQNRVQPPSPPPPALLTTHSHPTPPHAVPTTTLPPAPFPPPTSHLLPGVVPNGSTAPRQPNLRPVGALEPIAGVGTQIRAPETDNPNDTAANNTFLTHLTEKRAKVLKTLEATRAHVHEQGYASKFSPNQIMDYMQKAIDELPDPFRGVLLLDHWRSIQTAVAKPKVAEAILAGHLNPRQLAAVDRAEREEVTAQFDQMPEATFREIVWKNKDQDVGGL